ncbi:MAG: T9SS type A sorting domain-containing protein, partial [Bacteroidetes bacterium]|nr:T9SS type A sorting domain-containing protein [Bacteroidota bacterium]
KINILYDNKSINNMPSLVQIFDINGNLVYISSINMEKEFDISNLSNGSYFIKIDDSTKSFIISR